MLGRIRALVLALAVVGTLVTTASTAVAAPQATLAPTQVQQLPPAAPLAFVRPGTWWVPTGYNTANIWFFEPRGRPNGFLQTYLRIGSLPPNYTQYPFAYSQSGTRLVVGFAAGGRQSLTLLAYDPARDFLTVNYAGSVQVWAGCRSREMPYYARAACR